MKSKKTAAVILAGGSGSRMNIGTTKQKILILSESVLHRSAKVFDNSNLVDVIVVVAREDEIDYAKNELSDIKKLTKVVTGGNSRFASATSGVNALPEDIDYVAIHDSARCLVTVTAVNEVIEAAYEYGSASAAHTVVDTVKRVDDDGFVLHTVPRDELLYVSTPQVFELALYKKAVSENNLAPERVTDDNMLLENIGVRVKCVKLNESNLKITRKEDLDYARFILTEREKRIER